MNAQCKSSSTRFVLIMRKTDNFFDDCKKILFGTLTELVCYVGLCRRERSLLTREKNEKLIRASTEYGRNWDTTETSRARHRYNRSIFSWEDFFRFLISFLTHEWVTRWFALSKARISISMSCCSPSRVTRLILGDWKIACEIFFRSNTRCFSSKVERLQVKSNFYGRKYKWDNFMPQ